MFWCFLLMGVGAVSRPYFLTPLKKPHPTGNVKGCPGASRNFWRKLWQAVTIVHCTVMINKVFVLFLLRMSMRT